MGIRPGFFVFQSKTGNAVSMRHLLAGLDDFGLGASF